MKNLFILSLVLSLIFPLVTGCRNPEKTTKSKKVPHKADRRKKTIKWSTLKHDIKSEAKKEKGDDYGELVNWVVEEVHRSYPAIPDQKKLAQQQNLGEQKYKTKKKEELDELVIWVIGEVKTKLKTDKYIITKEDIEGKEEKPKFEY